VKTALPCFLLLLVVLLLLLLLLAPPFPPGKLLSPTCVQEPERGPFLRCLLSECLDL
jgi:hypothetical protein